MAAKNNDCKMSRRLFVMFGMTRAVVAKNSDDKSQQRHAISSRRSIIHLSEERIAPTVLEPNLFQTLHWFQFISKLMIFI